MVSDESQTKVYLTSHDSISDVSQWVTILSPKWKTGSDRLLEMTKYRLRTGKDARWRSLAAESKFVECSSRHLQ